MATMLNRPKTRPEIPNNKRVIYNTNNIGPDGQPLSDDSILVKFVIIQAVALGLAAIHGVVQRLPWVADWLRDSDYGGHLITNLGLTHINVVLGGTISIAGLTYYILPRIVQRPMYSRTLCNVSFWFTAVGVLGFYCALIPIGFAEGSLVHQGYTYEQAKDIVGFWHKFPEALTASSMGIGYWIYVTNVVLTIWQGRNNGNNLEKFSAKFHLVASIALLIGTLQGVYQVLPWSLDWLYKTGAAGQMIDPASHAHMNLVGGVIFAFMGFVYYFLPRFVGHPIHSVRLANFSFVTLFIGVFGFWLTFITLGFIEGDKVISQGITAQAARESMGIWHPLPIAIMGFLMALGMWTFIANVLLTLKAGLGNGRERYLGVFLGVSSIFLFISTSQGIIQIMPSANLWLEEAREAGELILPLSHAQVNIVGVVTLTLMTIGLYVLPRMVERPLYSHKLAKFSLTAVTAGVIILYVTLIYLGIREGILIRQGYNFAQARNAVTGGMHDWILVGLYSIVAASYIGYFINIFATIGSQRLVAVTGTAGNALSRTWNYMLAINIPAASLEAARRDAEVRVENTTGAADSGSGVTYAADSGSENALVQPVYRPHVTPVKTILNQNPLGIFGVEVLLGWCAFLGAGWLKSRRPAMAMLFFVVWQGTFWVSLWGLLTLLAPEWLPYVAAIYLILPVLSGLWAASSFASEARRLKRELALNIESKTQETTKVKA
ncbi:MAG TPA: cbb3-type cytochrome c oxidase subunit I [Chloroflexia bacterium]|nr:cbb3-type cytochrome c oxidase subunit I [Chloroflexia bacterium]